MGDKLIPQNALVIASWSRSKRVVFLVNLEQTNDNELNQIIRYNIGVWGGRFNAIIPANGEEIAEVWWNTLVAVDPDIIFSFFPLSEELLKRINRHILPYKIIEITPEDRKRGGGTYLIDTSEIGALDIQQIPQYVWAKRGSIREPYFFYIEDSGGNTTNVNFILRNFGVLSANASLNTAFRDLPYESIETKNTTPKECLLKLLAQSGKAVLPIDLCKMFAHLHYYPEYNFEAEGFHLVLGNSPLDVIYHWNRELLCNPVLGRNGFCLPKEMSEDEEVLSLICQWIKSTWWSQMQHSQGYVVSYSVDTEYLDKIAKKVSELVGTYFKPLKLESDKFPTPKVKGPKEYNYQQREHIPLSENKGLIGFQRPEFLQNGHPQQGWMVDLEIPFHPERYSSWTNFRPAWQLPKKLGISGRFFDPYRDSRIISNGFLSCVVTNSDQSIGIKIPSDQEVFWMFFENHQKNYQHRDEKKSISRRFYDMRTSDKGKYLQGMIQLFGNLYWCGSFFENHFWREIFLYMTGKQKNDSVQRYDRTRKELESFIKEKGGSIALSLGGTEVDELTEMIINRLSFRNPEYKIVTKKDLISRFGQLRSEGLKSSRAAQWWQANEQFDNWRISELEDLNESQILLQGAELTCNICGSKLWYAVDDIKSKMICSGCRSLFPLKTEPQWSYNLNDLVKNTLHRQGTLAMALSLYSVLRDLNGMFLWLPCQEFYEKDNNGPVAEVDLMYITNKKFVIGEVKSKPSGYKTDDFEKLIILTKELEPNEVVIAAVCETLPPNLIKQCEDLALELKPLEVKVRPLPLQW